MAKLAVIDDYLPWNMKWHKRWRDLAEKFKDNQFKTLVDNRALDASLFIDCERSQMFWRVNGFHNGTLFAYADINYCPMCGRKLPEANNEHT